MTRWAADLRRNRARRISRSQDDAGSPFTPSLFADRVPDPPQGPATAKTASAVTTLVRGMQTPVQVSCNVAHFNGDGTSAPCPGFEHGLGRVEEAPKARESDPETSRDAARAARPGGEACIAEIRGVLTDASGPMTQDEIARAVLRKWPRRWAVATIKTRISQADLHVLDHDGISERGQSCRRFVVESA